ncbi:MAG: hypothetical protein IT356_05260 [Gemmatimonadaceae bacterium]|nr:hypothetical protein [Gemmatimonadaceae bacterium]
MVIPRHALPILAAALMPALAAAQGRDQRGTRSDFGGMVSSAPIGLRLSNGDVEDMNPVKYLVDKRKDLKLSDDQLKQLRAMNDWLKESTKPQYHVLDSLRNATRARAGENADVERVRVQMAREEAAGVVKAIRDGYQAKLADAMAVLDESQKPKAEELLARQAKESEETLKDKMGAGRGGMGGGRRGGRPPAL